MLMRVTCWNRRHPACFFSRPMKHELHTSDRVTLVLVARTGPWSRPESTVLDSHGKHRDRKSQPAGSETDRSLCFPGGRSASDDARRRAVHLRVYRRSVPSRPADQGRVRATASWMAPQDPTTGSHRAYLRMSPRRPTLRRSAHLMAHPGSLMPRTGARLRRSDGQSKIEKN